MATYLARVELFGAGSREHNSLHELMGLIDFRRTITYANGEVMALPTGTYVGNSLNSASEIREKVRKLANPLSSKAVSVFVCQYSEWSAYLYSASVSALSSES